MTKTFTENDLVRVVYDEINEDGRLDLKESLVTDMDLRSSLEQISEAKDLLDNLIIKAPKDVVSRILYADKNIDYSH